MKRGRAAWTRWAALAVPVVAAAVVAAIVLSLDHGRGAERTSRQPAAPAPAPRARRRRAKTLVGRERRALGRFLRYGLPLYCGGSHGRYVALTFDDGPGPLTAVALRVLRRAHVRATFFDVGRNLASYPRLPREERALGAVGDHTWTHAFLPGLSRAVQLDELARTQDALARNLGTSVELFRPPYGARNTQIDKEAHALGMVEVLWSIDSTDSVPGPRTTWRHIGSTVDPLLRPGAIVLLHEDRGQTISAVYYRILPALRRRKLTPVTIPELLVLDPPSLSQLRAGPAGCAAHSSASGRK